ncbi:dTMP kinase [Rhodohalobacter sp. 614A]|uniref:dTMP kinase n=1 Tax=Rhodohalobacter sp. 614A TaxID=2908649 RepID=UPI001F3AE706
MLISFEGIDGCGKSTQIKLLKEYFDQKGIKYSVFREPGGTEISERIRSLLLHETDEMHPITELLLFSAARSQLIQEKVLPLLQKNEIVILDRFYDSTTAYQGYGRKSAELKSIHVLNQLATHHTKPDLTFYLKIDPKEAERRTSGNRKDRMENAGYQFFVDVSKGYDELANNEERIHSIDAMQSEVEVHAQIVSIIEKNH